jgi:DNA repair protein RadD
LIFACSIEHANHIAQSLVVKGVSAAVVHGELGKDERAYRLHAYASGEVRALVNVNVLTTGFDHPATDCVVLMRPTNSPGLYSQMVGRGMRIHPTKSDCLIIDLAQLVAKHGPVDAIRVVDKKKGAKRDAPPPAKLCPVCETFQATSIRTCINCQHEFPAPAVELSSTASDAPILSSDQQPTDWVEVTAVQYVRNEAKPPKVTDTLRVDYYRGYRRVASEWVCLEHEGFARTKAEQWWKARSPEFTVPHTIADALTLADDLLQPTKVALQPDPKNPKYTRVVGYEFPTPAPTGDLPKACWSCGHWLSTCTLWEQTPPADVQSTGCDDWTDLEPLPF